MTTTRICFVRHGETDWNAEKRIQGQIDIGLNETGRAQALAAARGLSRHRFSAIYASDLSRAQDTATTTGERLGLKVRPTPGLRERHYGIYQGLTAAEGAVKFPQAHVRYVTRDPHYDFESGESLAVFAVRVVDAVDALARHHPDQSILAVTHGGVLDIICRRATGRTLDAPRDFTIPNAALNWFDVDAAGWRLVKWADRHHLERVLEQSPE